MVVGLEERIESYAKSIKRQYPGYEAIYSFFVKYVQEIYRDKCSNISYADYFKGSLKGRDIVDSCVYYIQNSKASSESAIDKYLRAMTKLHRDVISDYTDELKLYAPFTKLANEVSKARFKTLREHQSVAPISNEEFIYLWKYFDEHTQKRPTQLQSEIILRLITLYGFKFIRIQNMLNNSFDLDNQRIKIETLSIKKPYVRIPKHLLELLRIHSTTIKNTRANSLMFTNTKGNQLTAAYLNYTFRQIEKYYGESKSYCATGLAKFAIIRLMKQNIPPLTIKELTGMEDILINDCARRLLEENSKNPDISRIADIDTFLSWNEL